MEPMAVSPAKSPGAGNQYLPSFLMGELASPTPGLQTSSPLPATNYSRSSRSKLEGPPIVGLFDEISSSPPLSPSTNAASHVPNSSAYHNNTTSFLDASCLENQENRNYWVVVYGFPPAQVNQIIAMFSQLGRVAEHNYPVNANWVCLCYTNQADMRKALSMNSKVLSGNVMIGVTERKQQVGNEGVGGGVSTPINTSLANISISSPTSPKIRPLAISKRLNAMSPTTNGPVPTADTSLVGKFMDFIFSW